MWIHLLEALFSWLAIPVFPLLLLAAMMSAEVLLDRTMHLFQAPRNRNAAK
jgi:hypothetical protein